MVNQNKIFSFKIKRQAKNVFPSDVKRTVTVVHLPAILTIECLTSCALIGRGQSLRVTVQKYPNFSSNLFKQTEEDTVLQNSSHKFWSHFDFAVIKI